MAAMAPAAAPVFGPGEAAERQLGELLALPDAAVCAASLAHADALERIGESVLESWLRAHGRTPVRTRVEGFRLLALHRQAARGDPSFNACRESCRELIFRCNVARAEPAEAAHALRLAAMVCQHLALFVGGKLQVAGLGEFCCAARPLRAADAK
jgi:hypothetical protein